MLSKIATLHFNVSIRKRIEGRNELQKILTNTGWLFTDKVLRMVANLFVGVAITRYLGPDQFGIFNYASAFALLFTPIASLGMDNIIVRDLVCTSDLDKNEILGTAFSLKLFGGICSFALAFIFILIVRPGDKLVILLVAIIASTTVFQAFDVIDFWYQSQVRSKNVVLARNAAFLLIAAFKLYLIAAHAPLVDFAWAFLFEIVVGAINLVIAYRLSHNSFMTWRFSISRCKYLIIDSWPLILSGFTVFLFTRVDQIMLAQLTNFRQVGIYSAAVRFIEVLLFLPSVVLISVYPKMVILKSQSRVAYDYYNLRLFGLFTWIGIVLIIGITLTAKFMMVFLLGEQFFDSYPSLIVLSFGYLFTFSGSVRSQIFVIENLTIYHTVSAVLGICTLIPLNFMLVPAFGAIGAALAVVSSYCLSAFGTSFLFPRLRHVGYLQAKALLFPIKMCTTLLSRTNL